MLVSGTRRQESKSVEGRERVLELFKLSLGAGGVVVENEEEAWVS